MSAITLSSGTVNTLVTGIKAVQGLAMRADRTFLVVDETSGGTTAAPTPTPSSTMTPAGTCYLCGPSA